MDRNHFFGGVLLLSMLLGCLLPGPVQAQRLFRQYPTFKFRADTSNIPLPSGIDKSEGSELATMQLEMTEADRYRVNYWNAAYPSYRWHQIMMEISSQHSGHKNGGRVVIMHLAIYDALVAVWEHKAIHDREAPWQQYEDVKPIVSPPGYSSFICAYSAVAGAASTVIAHYFPDRQSLLDSLLQDFHNARLQSGLQFPQDIEWGLQIGRQIAKQYIDYARTDRTDRRWDGTVPQADSLWSGTPSPYDPMKRQWRPLTLERADQFRPEPPPTDWTADMAELWQFNATHTTSDIAWKWKSAPVWDDLIERKILEYHLNPIQAAFANAVFHTARFDAIIAAWDGKYHYWGIRPFQYDPTFKPILVETPNFPGYPAGHTTVAGSLATALSFLFPQDSAYFQEQAWECSESRFEGGVHFRTDNEVGLDVGARVGEHVIRTMTRDM